MWSFARSLILLASDLSVYLPMLAFSLGVCLYYRCTCAFRPGFALSTFFLRSALTVGVIFFLPAAPLGSIYMLLCGMLFSIAGSCPFADLCAVLSCLGLLLLYAAYFRSAWRLLLSCYMVTSVIPCRAMASLPYAWSLLTVLRGPCFLALLSLFSVRFSVAAFYLITHWPPAFSSFLRFCLASVPRSVCFMPCRVAGYCAIFRPCALFFLTTWLHFAFY